jgi:hypothetical protein
MMFFNANEFSGAARETSATGFRGLKKVVKLSQIS